jgi:Flp pilus assembly protein TadB
MDDQQGEISQSNRALVNAELQTEQAKAQVEIARIQERVQAGWQKVIAEASDKLEKYSTHKASGERRYTTTLTIGILLFLVIITGTLAILTWRGLVSGESLLFFLGTLSGSVLMLVAERIKSQR